MTVVVLGDALLDVDVTGSVARFCPDASAPVLDVAGYRVRPGGAGLAAMLAAADMPVRMVTAVAPDADGERLTGLLEGIDRLDLVAGPARGGTCVKTRFRDGTRSLMRADRGTGAPAVEFPAVCDVAGALRDAAAVLVSDYGRGLAAVPVVRDALDAAVACGGAIVWDPHPRGPAPVRGATVVTPNHDEACAAAWREPDGAAEPSASEVAALGTALARRWSAQAVAVTCGERGAVLAAAGGNWTGAPAPATVGGDPCGAGDAFAARLTTALASGHELTAAVREAVGRASAFVAAGGASGLATPAAQHTVA